MTKNPLSSPLGQVTAFVIYAVFVAVFGIIIYALCIKDWSELIAGFVFGIYNYLIFARKLFRTKTISFDENYFYFKDDAKIGLSQIQNIQDGKITYRDKGTEKLIFLNPFFPSEKHELFYNYFKRRKKL